jgi:hypothetical protein
MAFALVTSAAWAKNCKTARGEGLVLQPGGVGTHWSGPVTLRVRGQLLEGQATVFIDPPLWAGGPAPPPLFHIAGFDWVLLDFGDDGSFTVWEMSYFKPQDPFFIEWSYEGDGRLGRAYLAHGSYGPWGTGMFENATGEFNMIGTMLLTAPDPVNSVEFTYKGRICGIQWDSE